MGTQEYRGSRGTGISPFGAGNEYSERVRQSHEAYLVGRHKERTRTRQQYPRPKAGGDFL